MLIKFSLLLFSNNNFFYFINKRFKNETNVKNILLLLINEIIIIIYIELSTGEWRWWLGVWRNYTGTRWCGFGFQYRWWHWQSALWQRYSNIYHKTYTRRCSISRRAFTCQWHDTPGEWSISCRCPPCISGRRAKKSRKYCQIGKSDHAIIIITIIIIKFFY